MKFVAYRRRGAENMRIEPAAIRREWMERTLQKFAYRCLPLTIANQHGWTLLMAERCRAVWKGGSKARDIEIAKSSAARALDKGRLSFHVPYLFQTDPGFALWVSGPSNWPKDGIHPLSALVETDRAPTAFEMIWQFTAANVTVEFAAGEPFCFFFPIPRSLVEEQRPRIKDLDPHSEVVGRLETWCRAREETISKDLERLKRQGTLPYRRGPYSRGEDLDGRRIESHRDKLELRPFRAPTQA